MAEVDPNSESEGLHRWPRDLLPQTVNQPITWKTVIRAALIWGPEYVILGYLEGASTLIRLTTVACCGVGLFALESERSLKSVRLFWPTLFVAVAIWIGIFSYAAWHRKMILDHLSDFYTESSDITEQQRSPNNAENILFSKKVNEWEQKTAAWLTDKIDLMTADQFLDRPAPFTLSYANFGLHSGWQNCQETDYLCNRDRLEIDRRNLAEIKKAIEHE